VRLEGGEGVLDLEQVFANDGAAIAQADYRLPLPEGATVSAFGFWRGERFLAAELRERAEAEHAHAEAALAGRASGLLRTAGPAAGPSCSFSIAPVPAGSLQRVSVTLRLPVASERGRSSLRLPLDRLLGQRAPGATAVVHLQILAPLRAFGVDGASPVVLARRPRRVDLALASDQSVEVWWSEEGPPLLTAGEVVPLDDGSFAVQLRLRLNDGARWRAAPRPLVLLVDASFSMRRRAAAVRQALERLAALGAVPARVVAVAEGVVELPPGDPDELMRRLFGYAGFHATWDDLAAAGRALGCGTSALRCVVLSDPQVAGLPAALEPGDGLELLLLAETDELAHLGTGLPPGAAVFQPGVEPLGKLHGLVDPWVLPVLELRGAEQRGGTLELEAGPRRSAAEGGMLRLFGASHSDEPIELHLAVDGQAVRRTVELAPLGEATPAGRAVRRGLFASRLERWMREYRLSRDPDLRGRIVELSLREEIPTELTGLQVAEAREGWRGVLPATATPAPLLRLAGLVALGLAAMAWWTSTAARRGVEARAAAHDAPDGPSRRS
jgi:hypothetical protein